MIRVNLLPHREIRRKRQQQQFYVMLGIVAALAVTVGFAVHTLLVEQLENQQARNTYLQGEIAKLDIEIAKIRTLKEQTTALLQRKNVVESLQANRAETVYLLDQLVRQLPDGVYLKGIAQKGTRVTINGYAQTNARVSTFMRNLDSSPYLENPTLVEIRGISDKNTRLSEFNLAVSLTRAKEDPFAKKPALKPVAGSPAMHLSGEPAKPLLTAGPVDQTRFAEGQLAPSRVHASAVLLQEAAR
jgi:type IV pilus assembly protein PilN